MTAREKLRKTLEQCTGLPSSVDHYVNPMRAVVLLDALDNPDFNDFEFYNLATKLLGPGAEKLPPAK